jgi:hypothetical protein
MGLPAPPPLPTLPQVIVTEVGGASPFEHLELLANELHLGALIEDGERVLEQNGGFGGPLCKRREKAGLREAGDHHPGLLFEPKLAHLTRNGAARESNADAVGAQLDPLDLELTKRPPSSTGEEGP